VSGLSELAREALGNEEKTVYYVFKFDVKTKKRNGRRKPHYKIIVYEGAKEKQEKIIFAFGVPEWYVVIDYLQHDERYARGKDYEYVIEKRRTKAGTVEVPRILFYNPECARRVLVYVLSLVGARKIDKWKDLMKKAVRIMHPVEVNKWFATATMRYSATLEIKNPRRRASARRSLIMRAAKAIRILNEHVEWWFKI